MNLNGKYIILRILRGRHEICQKKSKAYFHRIIEYLMYLIVHINQFIAILAVMKHRVLMVVVGHIS